MVEGDTKFKASFTLKDGSPVVAATHSHNCYFPSGWHNPYSHKTVAVVVENAAGAIAMVERHPDEPTEGGKLALPGGYVECGQRVIDAAEAEVLEETGYQLIPGTLGRFALLDGPMILPGRANERNHNVVTVFTAKAGEKVQEHDNEVTGVLWVPSGDLPPRKQIAFGHYDIIGMYLRHQEQPFDALPIVPSEMDPAELFLGDWLLPYEQ